MTAFYYDDNGTYVSYFAAGLGNISYTNFNHTFTLSMQLNMTIFGYASCLGFMQISYYENKFGVLGSLYNWSVPYFYYNYTAEIVDVKKSHHLPQEKTSQSYGLNGTVYTYERNYGIHGDLTPRKTGKPQVGDIIDINSTVYYFFKNGTKLTYSTYGIATVRETHYNYSFYFNVNLNVTIAGVGNCRGYGSIFNDSLGDYKFYGSVYNEEIPLFTNFSTSVFPLEQKIRNYDIEVQYDFKSFTGTFSTWAREWGSFYGTMHPRNFSGSPKEGDFLDLKVAIMYSYKNGSYSFHNGTGSLNVTYVGGDWIFLGNIELLIDGSIDATGWCEYAERNFYGDIVSKTIEKLYYNFTSSVIPGPGFLEKSRLKNDYPKIKDIHPYGFNGTLISSYAIYGLMGNFIPRFNGTPSVNDIVDMNVTGIYWDSSTGKYIHFPANGTGELTRVQLEPLFIEMDLNGTLLFGEMKNFSANLEFWYEKDVMIFDGYYKGYQSANVTGFVFDNYSFGIIQTLTQ